MTVTDLNIHKIIERIDLCVTEHGHIRQPTLPDNNMRILEIETVQSWLSGNDRVLEIFCGDGISTVEYATHCKHVIGCDPSESVIDSAKRYLACRKPFRANVSFEKCDVLDIDSVYSRNRFDVVVSIRGLINLPTREMQKEAILRIHNLLPQNGKFIFIEGCRNGLAAINTLRDQYALQPLIEPRHDNYFAEPELTTFLQDYFTVSDERNLDIYFLVSRVLYPLAAKPSEPEFGNVCNSVARLLIPYANTQAATSLLICRCLSKK